MKILLSVDDSPHSQFACDSVLQRPWPEGTQFLVFTVVEPYHPDYAGWDPSAISEAYTFEKKLNSAAEKLATKIANKLSSKFGKERVSYEVKEGRVKEAIVEKAASWQADFIVLGSHGRSGFQRFLLGSVSQAVVAHAPCSVEIIKETSY
ncbi:MAG: universal stress protein [Candidatus Obscuribacterales bacterium]|nr:universal stress protein [Candidatus Obscuribacterales bacterium]